MLHKTFLKWRLYVNVTNVNRLLGFHFSEVLIHFVSVTFSPEKMHFGFFGVFFVGGFFWGGSVWGCVICFLIFPVVCFSHVYWVPHLTSVLFHNWKLT